MNCGNTAVSYGFQPISQCTQLTGNVRRNIEVADSQVDQVGEAIQVAVSRSSIFNNFDNTVKAFTYGIGQISVNEGKDVLEVISQGADKLTQRGNTAAQGSGNPAFEELLCRGTVAVIPEVLELILEHPGAVDAAIGVAQAIEETGIPLGSVSGVHAKQPAQSLDRLATAGVKGAPLILTHLIDSLVQCLHDMEAVNDECGVGAVMLDRLGVGAAHVATGPQNACLLPLAQTFVEKAINGLTALSHAYPQDTRTIQVINQGSKLTALAEGNLIDAEGNQPTYSMPIADTRYDAVQQVGERRGGHLQDLGGGLLCHDLAQGADAPLQAVGDARIGWRPGNRFLCPPMRGALDLLRRIPEKNLHAHQGEVLPSAKLARMTHDPAASATSRATASVFVGLNRQMQLLVTFLKPKTGDFHVFQA